MIAFLKFMCAMAMYWWWMRGPFNQNRRLFSHRLAFHRALNPYISDVEGEGRIAWPDGFLYVTPKDVRRAAKAGVIGMRPAASTSGQEG